MDTDALIESLAADARPTPPLKAPWLRMLLWLGVSLLYVAAVVAIIGLRPELRQELHSARFVVEQGATLVTAIVAAFAAFCAIIPGRPKWILLLPLLPLAVWLGAIGDGCIIELTRSNGHITLQAHWVCVPYVILISALPATAMALMLRRGAPMYPHASVALGGLAAAALGNLGLWAFHEPNIGFMVLVWHMGTVAGIVALAGWLGPRLHHWKTARLAQ